MKKLLFSAIIVFIFCQTALAASTAGIVEAGNRQYKKQNYTGALKMYEQALLKQPDSALINYNSGTALYKDKKYKEANTFFERSLATEDKALEAGANYNLGNSKYMLGLSRENSDLSGAVQLLEGALNNYKRTMEITPGDQDVKVNYKIVEDKLKELKEKLKHQPQQQKNKGGSKQQQEKKQQSGKEGQENKQEQQGQENKQGQQGQENKQGQGEKKEGQEGQGRQEEEKQQEGQGEQQKQPGQQEEQQNQPGQQGNEQGQGQYGQPQEMSKQEANMLLEGYRSQELPAGMLNDRRKGNERQVSKDW